MRSPDDAGRSTRMERGSQREHTIAEKPQESEAGGEHPGLLRY
jgi:hypothetical protein